MFSSPFISKLGTNFCPTDDELKDISAYLAEPIEKLASLDTKIGYLQEALANVRIERDILHEHVEAHNALVSPLRRMPLDILQEIFVACLPTERNCVMSADEAPILLGRICSAWREIAYNTPRLWAKLHIFEPMVPSYYSDAHILSAASQCAVKLQQRAEVTKEWLTRSGDCPLSISFSCPNQFVDAARSIIRHHSPLQSSLGTHLRRCAYLGPRTHS
ncbi:hypothetical protein C8F01DRAFT_718781 [Mycena amicta]|nr:hypothetical protein C8F01DRAFT_718781 [Mycena amicta]